MQDASPNGHRAFWYAAGVAALLSIAIPPRAACAGEPAVAFDLPGLLACREVPPAELDDPSEHNGQARTVEVAVPVSLFVRTGNANAVEQVTVEVLTNSAGVRVIDFTPKTQLESDITGEIERTTTSEVSSSLGASLGGGVPIPYGELVAQVKPSANVGASKRNVTTESIKRLPPMAATVVSGTSHRGRGVFLQLRRSSQNTLEGVHVLTIRFAVPADWRISRAQIICRAQGYERLLWWKKETTWSNVTLPAILYVEGDAEAKGVAERAAVKMQ